MNMDRNAASPVGGALVGRARQQWWLASERMSRRIEERE
jgi:hypothetical protein